MTKFVGLLLFLSFAYDKDSAYVPYLGSFMSWVGPILLDPTPIKIRPLDLIMIGVLFTAKPSGRGALVAPMKSALYLALGTTVVWFLYGLVCGGEVRFASWQTYLIASTVLLAFAVAATFKTPADFYGLARWLIALSVFRAVMCWWSYFTWARNTIGESGAYVTDHYDTICWVTSILVLVVNAVERRESKIVARNLGLIFFLLGAIQFNSRRLAWVSLAMGLILTYILFPQGAAKRRIQRTARNLAPVLALYVIVGWGQTNPIFLPLRSLSTVSTQEDQSTLARNAENLGLITTANESNFITGTGWGRPYTYLTLKYDISSFELWRYIPHNSILGLLAFTGSLGFAGFWLAIPTSVFLNARLARLAADPKARSVGIVGAGQLIVCINQLYGDMGIFSSKTMFTVAVTYGIALRLPSYAGVWGTPPNQAGNAAKPATAAVT